MKQPTTYFFNGSIRTLEEIAEIRRIPLLPLAALIRRGKTLQEALIACVPNAYSIYELDGVSKSLRDWARDHGMNRETLVSRINRGMSLRQALTQPVRTQSNRKPVILLIPVRRTAGGYQTTSPKTTGTGLGSVVVERGDFTTENKTENQPSKAGE